VIANEKSQLSLASSPTHYDYRPEGVRGFNRALI
jgi:hypothetical protein